MDNLYVHRSVMIKNENECPRCHRFMDPDRRALSRRHKAIHICHLCGGEEALIDLGGPENPHMAKHEREFLAYAESLSLLNVGYPWR